MLTYGRKGSFSFKASDWLARAGQCGCTMYQKVPKRCTKKDVLPAFHQSNIVYQFLCHCDSRYVGRTSQRLQQRIKQHVPKTILQKHISQDRSTLARSCKPIRSFKTETSFSAIGQHLLQNPTCAHEYNDNKFSILSRGRTSFHLSTLEATYIKTSKPNLCKQKEFVYGLKIAH